MANTFKLSTMLVTSPTPSYFVTPVASNSAPTSLFQTVTTSLESTLTFVMVQVPPDTPAVFPTRRLPAVARATVTLERLDTPEISIRPSEIVIDEISSS